MPKRGRDRKSHLVFLAIILFENQIQTTSASPYRTQVQLAASFLVCSLIFIEYNILIRQLIGLGAFFRRPRALVKKTSFF